jgi:hypothetical protein
MEMAEGGTQAADNLGICLSPSHLGEQSDRLIRKSPLGDAQLAEDVCTEASLPRTFAEAQRPRFLEDFARGAEVQRSHGFPCLVLIGFGQRG